MKQVGNFNPAFTAEAFGLQGLKGISYNLDAPLLYEEAIRNGEAQIAHGGPLVAETGVHTG
ncbi:MAG: phosphoenolpyruvate carboxykinase, partial [Methylobacteriaceae bacterium]|nr:phosphoenolpyruvate carboxykinase [Methylobacteriaceae bacterium]